ncbi:glycosyl hydrolase family 88 [Prolixibacteraceae bacterium JC049]|nr:glycosyl hydrolase family 88 [Prolixibacteraceae bacterium JC049]
MKWSEKLAETIMNEAPELWQVEGSTKKRWEYTKGLMGTAFMELYSVTDKKLYLDYAKTYTNALLNDDGSIKGYRMSSYNIDKINSGKMLFPLWKQSGDSVYVKAIHLLRKQLETHPRTSAGGYWHKKRYPHQMWLDGLYMGAPFLAEYAKEFNDPESLDIAMNWLIVMEQKARDANTGLLYHGWDESKAQKWADKNTGCSPNFWGRGMGWYAMALVDVLDFVEEHPSKDKVLAIVNRLAEAIVKVQDKESGVWFQVLDKPDTNGNYREGSVSAMFTYFLYKAVYHGYIDRGYLANANKAYGGIINHLIKTKADGGIALSPVCAVAGLGGKPYRDGSVAYYINEKKKDNDPKGSGPFILAGIWCEKCNENRN